jgi:uncharacterized protein (DUF849 family)
MESTIINLCPTGMVPTKEMTPHVPITPKEIGASVALCAEIGASIAHIHPRDEDGKPTADPEVFKRIVSEIRTLNDKIIICATTSGRLWNTFEKRSALLRLEGDYKPDMASLTLGSNNFARTASVNPPQMIKDLAMLMEDKGIKPELEVFEPGMLHTAKHLMRNGYISEESPYFNILLNSPGTAPLDPSCFAAFHALLPENAIWSVAGIGYKQLYANTLGIIFGHGVRVGLEDSIHDINNNLTSNSILVEMVGSLIRKLGKRIATIEEVKGMLDI